MSVLGLIVEYNPFHNGHLYHFNTSLAITQAEYSICVMSGSFMQRGEPAIVDKWSRARMALNAGIDLVLELPVIYCAQSAEYFAYGAISLLNSLGIVDILSFGSEIGDMDLLMKIGSVISNEPNEYKKFIKKEINNGNSFASSRAEALLWYMGKYGCLDITKEDMAYILKSSNNILSLEYIKWLIRLNSSMKPITIKRAHSSYNDEALNKPFASAVAVRNAIKQNNIQSISSFIPEYTKDILKKQFEAGKGPVLLEDFSQILLCLLRNIPVNELLDVMDVSEGLENRIKKAAISSCNLDELLDSIVSKRYAKTRIKRILINSLLKINRKELLQFQNVGGPQYVRVLGFTDKGRKLISMIKESCKLPVFTNTSDYRKCDNIYLKKMIELDILSTDIYVTSYLNSKMRFGGWDFYEKPVIL